MLTLDTKRILVPYDFSATAENALKHAASIAKGSGGELLLFYALRNTTGLSFTRSMAELREMAEESESYSRLMEKTAEQIGSQYGITVKVHVGFGRTLHQIIAVAKKRKMGMIVMGTQGSESVSHLFSGSNSHQVVARSEVPVLTVRGVYGERGYSKILLPIDLSAHTRQKVIIAIQMARLFNASIHLLGIAAVGHTQDDNKLRTILLQVKKRIEEEEIPVDQELMHTSAAVTRTLMCAKRVKADLIISMTDQENSANESLFASSYDRALVDESNIPVLSIPPEIHEENIAPISVGGMW